MRKIGFSALALLVGMIAAAPAADAAQGLSGAYYQLTWPGTNANALSGIVGLTPAATFTATTICFPSCGNSIGDGNTLATFLSGNATGLTPNSVNDLSGHVIILTGQVNLTTGDSLTLASDDGSAVWINGTEVLNDDGDHGFGGPSAYSYTGASGWQSIKVLQFEDVGSTGLTVELNNAGLGGDFIQSSAAPEPATWAMMLLGFGGLGFAAYRRKLQAAVV